MVGRNGKFSPELAERIAAAVSTGLPKKYAAESNGISETTLYEWLRGSKGISRQDSAAFALSITRAEAQAVSVRIDRIAKAAQGGEWKADTWYLEHVHSDVFRKAETREVTGPHGGAIQITSVEIVRKP